MRRKIAFHFLTLLIACNYAAFRLELFEKEYEENHPPAATTTSAVTRPSLTWETFDKDNAVKSFTIDPSVRLVLLLRSLAVPAPQRHQFRPFRLTRDKSPPDSPPTF